MTENNNLTSSTDPQFVSITNDDYHLQNTSPALDAGQVISGITDGYSGSAPDEGAYEFGGAAWTPGCNFAGCRSGSGENQNYIANSGFESGVTDPWTPWSGAPPVSVITANAHTGSHALQVGVSYSGLDQIVNDLSANTTYILSAWAKVAISGEQVNIGLKNYGGSEQYQTVSSTNYTLTSISFTTGASNTSVDIYIYKNTGSGNAWGDDFALVAIPPNLLTNPGFESGSVSPWVTWTGVPAVSVVSSNAHSGTYAVQLGAAYSGMDQVVTGLNPNTSYTLTAWAKVVASGEQVNIGLKNYGGAELYQTITTTSYGNVSITFTTGSSNTSVDIYIYKNTGSSNGYGDDFTLQQVQ